MSLSEAAGLPQLQRQVHCSWKALAVEMVLEELAVDLAFVAHTLALLMLCQVHLQYIGA